MDTKIWLLPDEHFSVKRLQLFYYAPYFVIHLMDFVFSFFNLQLYLGHPECVAAFKSFLSVLAASPNQPLSDLIKKGQNAYKGNVYFHYLLF